MHALARNAWSMVVSLLSIPYSTEDHFAVNAGMSRFIKILDVTL